MAKGYNGKILIVNLTSGKVEEEHLEEKLYRDFVGGVGLGVRLLYQRQIERADPLGEQNILGFMPGLLGGTNVPGASRMTIVAKSPLTGTWGDASMGGFIGHELKCAGYDGILVLGIAPNPVYLLIYRGKAELRDATHLWGKDTIETEEILHDEIGDHRLKIISIGPSGESKSLISAIITERGSGAAGRSGLGAVMGSKLLKAIAVRGEHTVPVADSAGIQRLRQKFIKDVKETTIPFINTLKTVGTQGSTHAFITTGATPIKNWSLIGIDALAKAMPSYEPYESKLSEYKAKRTACATCPIGCRGTLESAELGGEYSRPEYETIASFGPMCLNDDIISVIKANDICNRYGIDTISAGSAIAFAIECYENGVISTRDTDGIELTWGNSSAIIAMLDKMVRREGFGDVLADGASRAAEKIGHRAKEYVIDVGGQEVGFHDPRQFPSRGTGYICDPTPGRHTTFLAAKLFESGGLPGPYPELWGSETELRDYEHKSLIYNALTKYEQVATSAGICKFIFWQETWPLIEFIAAATGWDFSLDEMLVTGERIQTMRQLFNIREGLEPNEFQLPKKLSQPATTGPHKDISVDFDTLRQQYYKAMGWNPETGYPVKSRLEELGIRDLVNWP